MSARTCFKNRSRARPRQGADTTARCGRFQSVRRVIVRVLRPCVSKRSCHMLFCSKSFLSGRGRPRTAKRLTMKTLLLLIALIANASPVCAALGTNGFLVFEIERLPWHGDGPGITQKFKAPLTEEFISNFRHLPNQTSSGTGFCCAGGGLKAQPDSTRFMWWIRKTTDGRWSITRPGSHLDIRHLRFGPDVGLQGSACGIASKTLLLNPASNGPKASH
jgi:hypothetical protein